LLFPKSALARAPQKNYIALSNERWVLLTQKTPGLYTARSVESENMAEYGEWNRKGATLSDVTARKEYGVSRDFIVHGIRAGKLEYREGSIWGNPYLRILRSQLEHYIAEQFGSNHLAGSKVQTELRKVNKEIAGLMKKLAALQVRKTEMEKAISK
jgi:hypothetical protein